MEHPVLFLSDPYSDDEVPGDTGAALVSSTESCIAFQVQAYTEGDADVIISDEPLSDEQPPAFEGHIDIPSKTLSLSDSQRFNYIMLPLTGPRPRIQIWYHDSIVLNVWIRVEGIALF